MTPTSLIAAALREQHHPRHAASFEQDGPQTVEERAMMAVIERLVEALEPFAREALGWDAVQNGGHTFADYESIDMEHRLRVGDVRRARTVLEASR